MGLLKLNQKYYESEGYLIRGHKSFHALSNSLRGAQSNETLARL